MAKRAELFAGTFVIAGLILLIAYSNAAENEEGTELAATCAACHGAKGSNQGIPPLAGLAAEKIISAMTAYKANERPNHIMHAVALSLSDEELARVARYLAQHSKESNP
jgi:sulfide dehydrogenase cytochrome subunit